MGGMSSVRTAWCSMGALGILALAGCGGAGANGPDKAKSVTPAAASSAADSSCSVENWCTEHGVPEEVCAQCNAKLAAEYQKKGDWCQEHNRPKSQCFLCSPERAEKFAAEYEAKYGKKPPTPDGT
jgi:hypothetical protein